MAIRAQNIVKNVGESNFPLLKGIDLEISEGEFVSIVGKSGSGKSSLLYVLSSLDRPSQGSVEIDGEDIYKLSDPDLDKFRTTKIGFIFQFHFLLPELTALENVIMPLRATGHPLPEQIAYAHRLIEKVGLQGKEHRLPRQLSGGEQQRVAIARAFVRNPTYLFADEPTGSLDSQNGQAVMGLLEQANKEFGTTVILVTHDSEFAKKSSRTIRVSDGKILA